MFYCSFMSLSFRVFNLCVCSLLYDETWYAHSCCAIRRIYLLQSYIFYLFIFLQDESSMKNRKWFQFVHWIFFCLHSFKIKKKIGVENKCFLLIISAGLNWMNNYLWISLSIFFYKLEFNFNLLILLITNFLLLNVCVVFQLWNLTILFF